MRKVKYIPGLQSNTVQVTMDKKEFEWVLDSYKELWANKKFMDSVAALNLVREILNEMEKGCK